jgi:acetylornithine deacetylase
MTGESKVLVAIEKLESDGVRTLQELVRIPSPIGNEGAAQAEVARRFKDLGLETHVFDIDPSRLESAPLFNRYARNYKGRPCVVGVLKGTGRGKSIVLNGHADAVPPGDDALWKHGPYSGAIEDGNLYGRGAWDDKAGVAQMITIAAAFRESGVRLKGDVVFTSVVEDEESGNGSLACIERGLTGDAVIVLDGTWPERFIVTHMGHIWFEITLRGRGAPSSVAFRGLNPFLGVGSVVRACEKFIERRNREDGRPWGAAQAPYFLNLGRIEGGDYPGSVPRSCRILGHYGFLPPMTPDQAKVEMTALIAEIGSSPDWPLEQAPELRFYGSEIPHFVGRNDSSLVESLVSTVKRLRDKDVIENIITGWCDLRHYESNPWRPPIPGLLYGPGGGANAHIENEYFRLSDFVPVAQNVASVALQWCGEA